MRNNLLLSVMFAICAEIFFTFYINVSDWPNVLGHAFKVMSFYFIYKGLLDVSLTRPFTTMFNDLVRTNQVVFLLETERV